MENDEKEMLKGLEEEEMEGTKRKKGSDIGHYERKMMRSDEEKGE
jgi:hypothetical protein